MKRISLSLLVVCTALLLHGQRITGIVKDSEGKILPFASVFIPGTEKGTNANNLGIYALPVSPGNYTISCQSVGYKKIDTIVLVGTHDLVINFHLPENQMTLPEVILTNSEDPAYEIIRRTIARRTFHLDQFDKFSTEVYSKGQIRLRSFPKKLLGQKVELSADDTSRNNILYLSETVSTYAADRPDKVKIEVGSSKVSGQSDGFGLSVPQFLMFYENKVSISNTLNPRGFISPVADNALNYYNYKLEGSYLEDGKEIDHIKVIPKRNYEPLFSGYIDIVSDEWKIHSVQLLLTKKSQLQLLDTLAIEQLYRPLTKDHWFISNQVLYPSAKFLGFDGYGSFINIYSKFTFNPEFDKNTFSSTVLKYTDSANKKDTAYWQTNRPIPLLNEEIRDYARKDSIELLQDNEDYLDSINKRSRRINPIMALAFEQTSFAPKSRTTFSFRPISELISFNPAEGWVINPDVTWTKRLSKTNLRKQIYVSPVLRYGFLNRHFNAHVTSAYTFGDNRMSTVKVSGGKRVFQFNNFSPIGQRGNSLSSLLSEENRMKTYEAKYLRGSYQQEIGDGLSLVAGMQYQNRMPLDNRTDYTWRDKPDREYTPNYPSEIVNENIKPHQSLTLLLGINWQPGNRYVEFPNNKISLGSKLPLFELQYVRGINKMFGSDADFSKWRLSVSGKLNLKMPGRFRYRLGAGGFFDAKSVQLPDYNHFNGNLSTFATEYLNSFQLLPIYLYSNTDKFYSLAHIEHNFSGFLTNKIPGIKRLNLYLVVSANAFYISSDKNYYEFLIGFDNIFKRVRVDYGWSFTEGRKFESGFKIGWSISSNRKRDDWP